MEAKLFSDDDIPDFTTAEWYGERERAPHLEQWNHQWRLEQARVLVAKAVFDFDVLSVSDLGAGDGGFLSTIKDLRRHDAPIALDSWGYDLQPTNIAGAAERGVNVTYADFLVDPVHYGDLTVCTECLEHLVDPHGLVRDCPSPWFVGSSPVNEHAGSHYAFHLWAWDRDGYAALLTQGGYEVVDHVDNGQFQVILGRRTRGQ